MENKKHDFKNSALVNILIKKTLIHSRYIFNWFCEILNTQYNHYLRSLILTLIYRQKYAHNSLNETTNVWYLYGRKIIYRQTQVNIYYFYIYISEKWLWYCHVKNKNSDVFTINSCYLIHFGTSLKRWQRSHVRFVRAWYFM